MRKARQLVPVAVSLLILIVSVLAYTGPRASDGRWRQLFHYTIGFGAGYGVCLLALGIDKRQ